MKQQTEELIDPLSEPFTHLEGLFESHDIQSIRTGSVEHLILINFNLVPNSF